MSLTFNTLRWKNFLSTGNDWTEMQLDGAQTTLIIGENGAGKSTVLDALCFVLFSKPFRKINKPTLINSINRKGCLVEVEFFEGKDEYVVRRGMRPNVFEIVKNGTLMNQDAANKDYQDVLEKYILKLNYKSFCQVVILGSASFVPFMQLPAGHRREIIEDLLDIQIFTTMNLLLKDKISENSRQMVEADHKFNLNNEKIKMHEEHLESMRTSSQEQVKELEDKILGYDEEIAREERIIEEKRREQESLIGQTHDYDKLVRKLSEMNSIHRQLDDKVARLHEEREFFHTHENCPTCEQTIGVHFRETSIQSRDDQVKETNAGIEQILAKQDEIEDRVRQMKSTLDRISSISTDISIRTNKVKGVRKQIDDLHDQIERINHRHSQYSSDNKLLKNLEAELVRIADEKKVLFEEKEIHRLVASVLKDNGIKARIIKQYIPIINKLINKYLAAMDFFVQFELDENFNETIKSRFRDEFSYSSFSEGEKSKIDLALLFTWRTISRLRNSASTNILILDEVFDGSLDGNSSDELLKILIELSNDSNITVISHKTDQLLDKFERVIRFEKKNNFSRIAA